jgi:hypothetical protein
MNGFITEVEPGRGVTVVAQGTLLQCAWGNGQLQAASYDFEPGTEFATSRTNMRGLGDLFDHDLTLSPYRGKAVVLLRPIRDLDLDVVEQQELAGLIAPSMPVHLREKAMQLKVPVILTEGFGKLPPTMRLYELLLEKRGNQAVFDAQIPDPRHNTRPEIIIPLGAARQDRPVPDVKTPLRVGMIVRLRRAPYAGQLGKITQLPDLPMTVESGLRVLCAYVKLDSGETIVVPLANIESVGASVDKK